MKAIILAAGEGSRLRPHTAAQPKCMLQIGGRPLLAWQLDALRAAGIDDVCVVAGYRAEQITLDGLRMYVNEDFHTTNMVSSLWCAESELHDDVVVAYADIVYEPRVVQALLASPHDLSVVVDDCWQDYWNSRFGSLLEDAETLRLSADDRVLDIGQKPESLQDLDARYVGLLRFRGAGLERLRAFYERAVCQAVAGQDALETGRSLEAACMTDLLQALIHAGEHLHAVRVARDWLEFDTRSDYEAACLAAERLQPLTVERLRNELEVPCTISVAVCPGNGCAVPGRAETSSSQEEVKELS